MQRPLLPNSTQTRTVTVCFQKDCKLLGVSQIFIKFTDYRTGLRQTCKTDSVIQVCFRPGFRDVLTKLNINDKNFCLPRCTNLRPLIQQSDSLTTRSL